MIFKTDDSAVLRIETVCVFIGLDVLCVMNEGVSRAIGAVEMPFGIGHSPPS